jgi:hypothetical protein
VAFENPRGRSRNRSLWPDDNIEEKTKHCEDLPLKNETIPRSHDHGKGAVSKAYGNSHIALKKTPRAASFR